MSISDEKKPTFNPRCQCGAEITEYELTNYGGRCKECELIYIANQEEFVNSED